MSDVKTSTDKTESDSAEIAARADQINEKVDKEMMPKIEELQKIHSGDFEDIRGTSKLCPLLPGSIGWSRVRSLPGVRCCVLEQDTSSQLLSTG